MHDNSREQTAVRVKAPRTLECTLRDGSYAINFQFAAEDTRAIVTALELLGFDMIEVGHGAGLGASDKGLGVAAEADEVYLRAAAESAKKADWGMFCIPGAADLDHVVQAAHFGMRFIRVGTNVENHTTSRPYIELAKKHGMFVCANFMKSYVCEAPIFASLVLEAEKYGADLVYIVDSAGGMLPDDIARYVDAIRQRSSTVRLGFHGHHNLGLGVANSLKAYQLGVEVIDTSLQGFGRSAGNTPTEQFLCTLMRYGVDLGIDPIAVMDVAEKHILPLVSRRGLSSVDVVAGLARFHSSYMGTIEKFATQHRVDPRRLIIAICQQNLVDAPEIMVESQARLLAAQGLDGNWKPPYQHYYGSEQTIG